MLIEVLNKDSTNLDIMQEVGKICYFLRDYESAYKYYSSFIDIKEALNLDIYPSEDAKIAVVYSKMGYTDESERLFNDFKAFTENTVSLYKDMNLAMYYSYQDNVDKAIEHLELFSQEKDYHYWIILFVEMDPLVDNIRDHPEFKRLMQLIEVNFWRRHKEMKDALKKDKLL